MDDAFIGRATELAELTELLEHHRLVTIVGAPGVGKTRLAKELAVELAGAWADGVHGVELAAIHDGALVVHAVARALGVAETSGQTLAQTVLSAVGERHLLIVVDNCEHQRQAVSALVTALIESCSKVTVLATSRTALAVDTEVILDLRTLPAADATELFVRRAPNNFELTEDNAPAIKEICARLDALPLAIELAAARANILAVGQLLELITTRCSTVVADPHGEEARHGTLDDAIRWSWELLAAPEQAVLRRLSVFAGGATMLSAQSVCSASVVRAEDVPAHLESLVANSLVVSDGGRWRLLETIRHFARERLVEAGESAEARNRHATWATALAESAESHLTGADQGKWLECLDAETANLRAALQWCIQDEAAVNALHLSGALILWWRMRGATIEGRNWMWSALAIDGRVPEQLRAKALWGAGLFSSMTDDLGPAVESLEESLAIARSLDDDGLRARSLLVLGSIAIESGDQRVALPFLEQSITLARQADDGWCLVHALSLCGDAHQSRYSIDEARPLLEEAVAVARRAGGPQALAYSLVTLGNCLLGFNVDHDVARALLHEAFEVASSSRLPMEALSALCDLGLLAVERVQLDLASTQLERCLDVARERGSVAAVIGATLGLGRVALARSEWDQARARFENALAEMTKRGMSSSNCLVGLAQVAAATGRTDEARAVAEEALAVANRTGFPPAVLAAHLLLTCVNRRQGWLQLAHRHAQAALEIAERTMDTPGAIAALETLAGHASDVCDDRHAVRLMAAAAHARDARDIPRFPPDVPDYAADIEHLRARLSPETFAEVWTSGWSLPFDRAIALARQGPAARQWPDEWKGLSDAERVVAELAAEGLSNHEIAERLFVSRHTVRNHLSKIFATLGISSRTALVAAAKARGAAQITHQ